MSQKLYVGNLPFETTEDILRELFSTICSVEDVKVIMDRDTGKSRGFAFVTVDNGDKAINNLNDKDLGGRSLRVSIARERTPRDLGGYDHGGQRYNRGYNNRY